MNKITREMFFEEWVARLRSNKYQQITGKLTDGDGYCCLGIACELGLELGIVQEKNGNDYDDASFVLPRGLRDFLNITSQGGFDPRILDSAEHYTLSQLNDEAGMNFAQIADVIELALKEGSFTGAEEDYE